jgi:hypothetical protein
MYHDNPRDSNTKMHVKKMIWILMLLIAHTAIGYFVASISNGPN